MEFNKELLDYQGVVFALLNTKVETPLKLIHNFFLSICIS